MGRRVKELRALTKHIITLFGSPVSYNSRDLDRWIWLYLQEIDTNQEYTYMYVC